jgi:serine protease Do
MLTRKSSVFYAVLIALVSVVTGMVIASRLDLAPRSFADVRVPATNSAPLTGAIDASTFRNIAKEAGPSVVSITVTATRPAEENDMFELPFPFGGGRRGQPEEPPVMQGAGSGFIIDKAGYIITNNHVVENARNIEVQLSSMDSPDDGLPAKVVGRDELSDLALIQLTKLPAEPLVEAKFGDSSQLASGDWVMAIGNPFRFSNTVTVGVVSYNGRHNPVANGRWADFIQTDAAINRGNSGGPLLNIRGEVVGVNTMIVSDTSAGGNVGVGFAIPINTVRDLLPQLRSGKVTRGRIGVAIDPHQITKEDAEDLGLPGTGGATVSRVENGPAKDAGMQLGDVIVEFNGRPVKNSDELVSMVTSTAPGTTVPVKIVRNHRQMTLNVKVGELDLDQERTVAAARGGTNAPGEPTQTGSFGMSLRDLTSRERDQIQLPSGRGGVLVANVTPFGPASQAGLNEGDVLLSIQGDPVRTAAQAASALDSIAVGRLARIVVWRDGQEQLVQVRKR